MTATALPLRQIADVALLIERRELSSQELVSEVLGQIARLEPKLHSFITVFEESAMSGARAADEAIGQGGYRGALHGIPIAVKDNLAVAGWPTTNGSVLWAQHVTSFDATAVSQLRAEGAVIIGKNNMHEWAMGGTCSGMHFGTVHNPWDLGRVPGGSSGGSAAAVSAGLAFGAVGNDGWGSIRTPASYCGIVGLKPSPGLVSRFGELPPTSSPIHQTGPLARSVRDVAIMLQALVGYDPLDPTSRSAPQPVDYLSGLEAGVAGLRVGVARTYFLDDAVVPVRAAVEKAADVFASLGASVSDVELDSVRHVGLALAGLQTEAQSVLLPLALEHPEGFASQDIRFRILAAELVSESDARRGRQIRNAIAAEVRALFERVDIVLAPTNSTPAFLIDADTVELGDGTAVDMKRPGGQSRVTTRLTLPWNLAGVPALSLPSDVFADGLPVGVQLVAGPWNEALLIRAARALELATGGYHPPPLVGGGVVAVTG